LASAGRFFISPVSVKSTELKNSSLSAASAPQIFVLLCAWIDEFGA
jgi:hypothetical protein